MRASIVPSARLMNVTSTVCPLGSWNDDVFTGGMDNLHFLSGDKVECTGASDLRASGARAVLRERFSGKGEGTLAECAVLAHPLREAC